MPSLHIITGSNGAGKSTVGSSYLPEIIQSTCEIFDGDKIFMEKKTALWNSGNRAHKEIKNIAFDFVSNLFETKIEIAMKEKSDFVYEGHFTNDETWQVPKKFKEAGYSIHLTFFGLANTDISELRVLKRTNEGGHFVPSIEVANNFYGNLEKLNINYQMFDSIQIVDTSEIEHQVLCLLENNVIISHVDFNSLPDWFTNYLPELSDRINNLN